MIDIEALEGIRAELKRTPYTEFSADNVRALVGMVDELMVVRTWQPIEIAPRSCGNCEYSEVEGYPCNVCNGPEGHYMPKRKVVPLPPAPEGVA